MARDLRDADPRDRQSGASGRGPHRSGTSSRDHAPARRVRIGARPSPGADRPYDRRRRRSRLRLRNDDRAAARRTPSRRARAARRLLLVWHERPDQTTLGFSRDDAQGRFLAFYLEHGILADDPFATLDTVGVGELMRIAVERARSANPAIQLGICGEHGGDPRSIAFCEDIGLDYVSCSPFRLPVARLAAAQAALAHDRESAYVPSGG